MNILEFIYKYLKRNRPSLEIVAEMQSDWAKLIYIFLVLLATGVLWYRSTEVIMQWLN